MVSRDAARTPRSRLALRHERRGTPSTHRSRGRSGRGQELATRDRHQRTSSILPSSRFSQLLLPASELGALARWARADVMHWPHARSLRSAVLPLGWRARNRVVRVVAISISVAVAVTSGLFLASKTDSIPLCRKSPSGGPETVGRESPKSCFGSLVSVPVGRDDRAVTRPCCLSTMSGSSCTGASWPDARGRLPVTGGCG